MTSLRLLDDLDVNQIGLIARAVDVHRQAQVRKLRRTSSPQQRLLILADIGDLEHSGAVLKRVELDLLKANE